MKYKYKLIPEILKLSEAAAWETARGEWELFHVYEKYESDPDHCLCGHPILEICVLRNKRNGNNAVVGNVCVKKFLGLPSDRIFAALKRVRRSPESSLNYEAVSHAFTSRWFSPWDNEFYLGVLKKRSLTDKQLAIKLKLNQRFVLRMQKGKHAPSSAPL